MDIAVSIVAIIILILLFLLYRRTQATTTKRPPLPSRPGMAKPDSQFHAVSLKVPASACDAAKAMEGKIRMMMAAIFDGWACVGSANFDKLSFEVNREVNLATRLLALWAAWC